MTIPLQTIAHFRTTYNPFSKLSRPCRLMLSLIRTPNTTPTSKPTYIDVQVKQLPRTSTQLPEMTLGFKGGKEVTLEVGKRNMKIGDVVEEVSRIGRVIQREESLKG
jgi:large subunit ribosomal protein L53